MDGAPARSALLAEAPLLVPFLRSALALPTPGERVVPRAADARLAAVLAPLYLRAGRPHLLFTLRAAALSSHSGEISFPGGRHDPTDASLSETALRETQEELGIPPAQVEVLGALHPVYSVVSNFVVTPYVGWLPDGLPPLVPNPAEVAEVIELPLAALAAPEAFHSERWTRGGQSHTVYFYDVAGYRVWGLTARILYDMLAFLPER